jgi:hypothetical protein
MAYCTTHDPRRRLRASELAVPPPGAPPLAAGRGGSGGTPALLICPLGLEAASITVFSDAEQLQHSPSLPWGPPRHGGGGGGGGGGGNDSSRAIPEAQWGDGDDGDQRDGQGGGGGGGVAIVQPLQGKQVVLDLRHCDADAKDDDQLDSASDSVRALWVWPPAWTLAAFVVDWCREQQVCCRCRHLPVPGATSSLSQSPRPKCSIIYPVRQTQHAPAPPCYSL